MKPIIKEDDIVVLPGDEFDQAQDQMNRKTNLVTVILFSIFLSAGAGPASARTLPGIWRS